MSEYLKNPKPLRNLTTHLLLALTLLIGAAATPATADEFRSGTLTVADAYAFASIGRAGTGAVFLTIATTGAADELIGVESDDAARAELHTHIHADGHMKMRQVEGFAVPEKGQTTLQPGGNHIMLMGLNKALKANTRHALVLVFRDAGRMPVTFAVRKRQ